MTSIGDVARAAGVSPATVSRVLNGTGQVSAERADRVRKAADDLGYQPFGPARALRRQRTTVWSAIVADIENPFFTALIRGIEDVAVAENHRLVLCNSDEDLAKESAYIEIAISERMSGVVIAVTSATESAVDLLVERGVPVVAIDRRPKLEGIDSVLVDNELGAEQATSHLLSVGCRRVACITGPTRVSTASSRLSGYKRALAHHGIKSDVKLVRRGDFREDGGYRAARSLFDGPHPPDGLFVANNLMTLGALHALRETQLRIPDDVAVVGFDDAPWATLMSPQLSVVAQPAHEIGRQAARLLATASTGLPARHLVLAPTLVVRQSSTRP